MIRRVSRNNLQALVDGREIEIPVQAVFAEGRMPEFFHVYLSRVDEWTDGTRICDGERQETVRDVGDHAAATGLALRFA